MKGNKNIRAAFTRRKNKKGKGSKKIRNKKNTRKNKRGGMFRSVLKAAALKTAAKIRPGAGARAGAGAVLPGTGAGTGATKIPRLAFSDPALEPLVRNFRKNTLETVGWFELPDQLSKIDKSGLIRRIINNGNVTGSPDQWNRLKKYLLRLNDKKKGNDEQQFKTGKAAIDIMNSDPPLQTPGFFNKLRILEFLTNDSASGLAKIATGDTTTKTIMETIKPVLDKVLGAFHTTECDTILEIVSSRILGSNKELTSNLEKENAEICNKLKTKFIEEFSKNGFNDDNFSKFTDEHKFSDIVEILLWNKAEDTIDTIKDTVKTKVNEVIDKGFLNYSSRVAHNFFIDFAKTIEPGIIQPEEKVELEKLDKDYNDEHVSLVDFLKKPIIYSSIEKLLSIWNTKLAVEINNNVRIRDMGDNAKDSLKYLALLSCIDLRIGSLLEFFCAIKDKQTAIMCSPDIIKEIKISHFKGGGFTEILKNVLLQNVTNVAENVKENVEKNMELYTRILEIGSELN